MVNICLITLVRSSCSGINALHNCELLNVIIVLCVKVAILNSLKTKVPIEVSPRNALTKSGNVRIVESQAETDCGQPQLLVQLQLCQSVEKVLIAQRKLFLDIWSSFRRPVRCRQSAWDD